MSEEEKEDLEVGELAKFGSRILRGPMHAFLWKSFLASKA